MLNIKIEERQNGKTAVLKLEGTIDTPLFDQVSNEVKRELKHGNDLPPGKWTQRRVGGSIGAGS